jgi:hypothetical protein
MTITRSPSPDAGAVFSECLRYRYLLWRRWGELTASPGVVLWIMLNPSTADEFKLDPTLTRCARFTQRFGFCNFQVANLFALRSTDPSGLLQTDDPIGPSNDLVIREAMAKSALVVVGWGAFPLASSRAKVLVELAEGKPLHCLGVAKNGQPRHPLYLRADSQLQAWQPGGPLVDEER